MRVAGDDRRRCRLDEVSHMGRGEPPAQSPHGRRREDDVTDETETHEKDFQESEESKGSDES
jgi:hypothetical protein